MTKSRKRIDMTIGLLGIILIAILNNKIDKISTYVHNTYPIWLEIPIAIIIVILFLIILVYIVYYYNKIIIYFHKYKEEKKAEFFSRKVQRIEAIQIALDLSQQGKYKESNIIYIILLRDNKKNEDIDEIYANMGWNFIELESYKKALLCFDKGIKINPNNETIIYGIKEISKR